MDTDKIFRGYRFGSEKWRAGREAHKNSVNAPRRFGMARAVVEIEDRPGDDSAVHRVQPAPDRMMRESAVGNMKVMAGNGNRYPFRKMQWLR
jgi:hypothetical protein